MVRRVCMAVILVLFVLVSNLPADEPQDARIKELSDRVQQLENRVKELEELVRPMKGDILAKSRATSLRKKFEERMERDKKAFSQEELREIESLYQVANKQWQSAEAQESLKKLISKYGKANRTGCALLYLGQMSSGEDKQKYLKKAMEDFSDCWYGDGVQVGAYARFYLAIYYQEVGRKEDAGRLYNEIRDKYPDAVDHKGNLLFDAIPK